MNKLENKFISISSLVIAFFLVAFPSSVLTSELPKMKAINVYSTESLKENLFALHIEINADEKVRLYSWRGKIYPMLIGNSLKIKINGEEIILKGQIGEGKNHIIENVEKVYPKTPHRLDIVEAKSFKYPHPLVLKITNKEGKTIDECLKLTLHYDTTDPIYRYGERKFSPLKLKSNEVRICPSK